ncbi:hypothetical protein [Spirosoma sordidisoli]|uniref:Uncharacterized protein n=1 Tax=Spirosoma sordidisoli TaxID=2502893 RepID=A0A4Q2UP81_9BACT|nr:hypothetical protein [Spirosoma sordidisoli]RYC69601.1 hypothetical protein EQG79_13440 [Spirosoma sordidisoli]
MNKPCLPASINTLTDVHLMIVHLYDIDRVCFHPDDSFKDTVRENQPFYTPEMAGRLDALMEQAFELCQSRRVDLYGMCLLEWNLRFQE